MRPSEIAAATALRACISSQVPGVDGRELTRPKPSTHLVGEAALEGPRIADELQGLPVQALERGLPEAPAGQITVPK